MPTCPQCNSNLLQASYICTTTDYRVVQKNTESTVLRISHSGHGIPADDLEIGSSVDVQFCTTCSTCHLPAAVEQKQTV